MKRLLLYVFLFFPCLASAENQLNKHLGGQIPTVNFLQVFAWLALVILLIVGAAYVLKRLNGVKLGQRNGITVKSSLHLSTREKVLLVNVGETNLLIGVAQGNIRTLHVFNVDPLPQQDTSDQASFITQLQKYMQRGVEK